jgi:choline dehydrogenase-like flavoprotein
MFRNAPGFGADLKREIRGRYPAVINLYSQNGMIATKDKYVELDPKVKDVYGLAVPKIHYDLTTENIASAKDAIATMSEIIEASGGVITGASDPNLAGADSVHWCGTAKMGTDAKTSVLTPYLQSHDVKNLFVADGSGFVDFSEKNPTLTVMALASRCGDFIVEKMKRDN